jgi:hypothetical protein
MKAHLSKDFDQSSVHAVRTNRYSHTTCRNQNLFFL